MDRADVPVGMDRFAGEIERVLDRVAKTSLRLDAAGAHVAVRAAGVRVGRPVVRVPGLQAAGQDLPGNSAEAGQRVEAERDPAGGVGRGGLGARSAAPGDDYGRAYGQGSPP